MDFILNEKSLHGQFESTEEFLKSLSENISCFQLVSKNMAGRIWKITDFYKSRITGDTIIADLKHHPASDELRRFRIALEKVTETTPFWDEAPEHDYGEAFLCGNEDVSATSIAEAAVRNYGLLSFLSEQYADKILDVTAGEHEYQVNSVYTALYMTESFHREMKLSRNEYLKIRYRGTRIDCGLLEEEYGAELLENIEFTGLLGTLDKFVRHDSWESIALDDGLKYKKYSPSREKDNWFANSPYQSKQIMKFRINDKMRCFGYRKKEYFRLLRIERDHKISNKG